MPHVCNSIRYNASILYSNHFNWPTLSAECANRLVLPMFSCVFPIPKRFFISLDAAREEQRPLAVCLAVFLTFHLSILSVLARCRRSMRSLVSADILNQAHSLCLTLGSLMQLCVFPSCHPDSSFPQSRTVYLETWTKIFLEW